MGLKFPREKKTYFALALAIIFLVFVFVLVPSRSFPSKTIFTVSEGTGLYTLSLQLKEERVIRSPFWFRTFAILLGGERDMKAGEYYLPSRENSFTIAWRILHGNYEIETIKLTIPEGFSIKKISNLFDDRFTLFDHQAFESSAREGYLFPDTYFVPVTATASSTIKLLGDNFYNKIIPLASEIEESGKTLEEIITVASILEGETRGEEDMKIVSGVLWKRLRLGIPLQVDTSFIYINGKTTAQLTQEDLKIKSPYNTYLFKGLPPTPISNPGLESIKASIHPQETTYLYFLTGSDGIMHYAQTFEEHKVNKLKYLSK